MSVESNMSPVVAPLDKRQVLHPWRLHYAALNPKLCSVINLTSRGGHVLDDSFKGGMSGLLPFRPIRRHKHLVLFWVIICMTMWSTLITRGPHCTREPPPSLVVTNLWESCFWLFWGRLSCLQAGLKLSVMESVFEPMISRPPPPKH